MTVFYIHYKKMWNKNEIEKMWWKLQHADKLDFTSSWILVPNICGKFKHVFCVVLLKDFSVFQTGVVVVVEKRKKCASSHLSIKADDRYNPIKDIKTHKTELVVSLLMFLYMNTKTE